MPVKIQHQYQQWPHLLHNVALDHLLSPRLLSHYLPRPGLPIQDLTETAAHHREVVDRTRSSPPHVQNNPCPTPKLWTTYIYFFTYSPYQMYSLSMGEKIFWNPIWKIYVIRHWLNLHVLNLLKINLVLWYCKV